jgi:hypothetical protein
MRNPPVSQREAGGEDEAVGRSLNSMKMACEAGGE